MRILSYFSSACSIVRRTSSVIDIFFISFEGIESFFLAYSRP